MLHTKRGLGREGVFCVFRTASDDAIIRALVEAWEMRTTIAPDAGLVAKAQEYTAIMEKSALVREASAVDQMIVTYWSA